MRLPKQEYTGESIFDRFVRAKRLTNEQVEAWISWIGQYYDGPLFTRALEEVEAFYRGWKAAA